MNTGSTNRLVRRKLHALRIEALERNDSVLGEDAIDNLKVGSQNVLFTNFI